MMTNNLNAIEKAKTIFRSHQGVLRTMSAIRLGVQPRTLYAMREAGIVEPLGRGLFRLTELPPLGNPDLVSVALKAPEGIICLLSALSFHEITTHIPRSIYLSLRPGMKPPRLDYPPMKIVWFSGKAYSEGREEHTLDGVPVHIYCPEKTVADCFKYRNKIGLDVAIEALKLCRERKRSTVQRLMQYARICRVDKIMQPYLEAML
jgi:predicted transcriptional regulator of viral defense system